ncbi:peptide-methionine (R)-S-oxide reductase [Rufibacter sediminis]|uniref:peptide-methionine (R)-S-oxide reductase n=1 Tax=Rufibacter sediminis TaxID=2762756 RepID=A0ABR6VY86_9BACT|nr:peptide-methionine (R)-S-oxide reductase [Rufibacter sediminis]MBC3542187.1 peptide-methionine (R)-S-oxide reductase [Rufibacter sediminis]
MFENRKIDWQQNEQNQPKGVYACSRCGSPLFSSDQKFDSKTGFPSFWAHLAENVQQHLLETYDRERIQLLCYHCGLHLGHLFKDLRTPSQVRYCINADSIRLQPSSS